VIKDEEPVWKEDLYTPFGKWMDGWESRRRRTEGHDWCIIQLGLLCRIRAIEVNTAFFTGNFSPKVSIQATSSLTGEVLGAVESLCDLRRTTIAERPEFGRMGLKADEKEWSLVETVQSESWETIVPLQPLGAGYPETRKTIFQVSSDIPPVSFIRLNMGPDGGIARIRIYGEVVTDPESIPIDKVIDLLAIENGGMAIACSNKHYGHPRNLVAPGRGNCMGDGWETARQPNRPPCYTKGPDGLMVLPGYDWAILQLGKSILTRVKSFCA
jgi:allantoicase